MNTAILRQLSACFLAAGGVFWMMTVIFLIRFYRLRLLETYQKRENQGASMFAALRRKWYQQVSYEVGEREEITERLDQKRRDRERNG